MRLGVFIYGLSHSSFPRSVGIGRNCPRLLNLALSAIAHFDPINSVNPAWFSHLNALEVWCDTSQAHAPTHEQVASPCLLRQLLVSRNIKNLLFTACGALTDRLLNEIWRVSQEKKNVL